MHFESAFILDRKHLEECYDQSLPFSKNRAPRIKFMTILVSVAVLILLFGEQQDILAYFLIALTLLEYFSFRYRRAWWLTRQVWSKNSGNIINLIIDDAGIKTQSVYNNSQLLWSDIAEIAETEKGLMLLLKNGGYNYLSKQTLAVEVIDFIKQQKQ